MSGRGVIHPGMPVLLTGGAGFIGSAFARTVLGQTDRPLTVYDALTYSGNPANLDGLEAEHGDRYSFIEGDVCDAAAVDAAFERCRPGIVVHMAAETHVDRSIADATAFVRTNAVGTQFMLDAARRYLERTGTAVRFVQVSTDEVYGSLPVDRPEVRFTEESPLRPRSPYAASKAAGDCLAIAAAVTHGLDVVVTRCSNCFGPRQYPEKVIPRFVTNLIDGEPAPLYGDGGHVRDWVHVEDQAAGVLLAAELLTGGDGASAGGARVYNFGGSNERTNLELTAVILEAMGLRGDAAEAMIRRVPDRPGHDRRYGVDWSRAARELVWRPERSAWPEGIAATVRWYRENEAWWRPLKARSGGG